MHEAIYNSKLNLSEHYPSHLFKNLVKVFPRLNSIIQKNNMGQQPIYIEKFLFYQMILEKIKNYFELSESFVISESIDIIIKDLKNKKKITLNKTALPFINKYKIINNIKLNNIRDSKSPMNFHVNVTRNKKLISSGQSPLNSNYIYSNNNNTTSVNHIYLNLNNKSRDAKIKMKHFMEGYLNNNNNNIKSRNKKNIEKTFFKNVNFKINNSDKKPLNFANNYKNKNSAGNKQNLIMSDIDYSFVNKYPITIKKSSTESQLISFEKSIVIRNIDSIYQNNLENFTNIDDINFDIFEFEQKVGKENILVLIGKYLFNYYNFGELINQTKYDNWCDKIASGYKRTNTYHHDLHAADITHTSYIYFKFGLIQEIGKLDMSDICAVIMGCICHDYKHPGINNNFLIDTDDNIALTYNDISVLENMHVSEAFKLMHSDSKYNVFEGFDRDKYKKIRKQIIQCVLSTDMSKHSLSINFLKKCVTEDYKPDEKDKQEYMDLVIHTADISNPTKIFDVYFKWAKLVVEEFYSQGDKEKKLGLKCTCDRDKVTIYRNQIGFIDFIELPFFSLFVKAFPKLNFLLENLNNNKETILKKEEEHKKKEENKEIKDIKE